jgi:malonyl-CoA O-methyltransferase
MAMRAIAVPPKQRIASAFSRRAAEYDGRAPFQSELCAQLAAKLACAGLLNGRWADLGCGTGTFADECAQKEFRGRIFGVDIAFMPLAVSRKREVVHRLNVQADIECLPFRPCSFDVAVTASALQWLEDLPVALKNIAVMLKNGGVLGFAVFAEGSFRELFLIQQRFGIPAPVRCLETSLFAGALADAGFEKVEYETVEKTHCETTAAAVLKSVSSAGSSATAAERLLNRKELAEFCRVYEGVFGRDGSVPLTYRAIVGICRKGYPS